MDTPLETAITAAYAALVILETLPARMDPPGPDPILLEAHRILDVAVRALDAEDVADGTLLLAARAIFQAVDALQPSGQPMPVGIGNNELAVALLRSQANKIVALYAGGAA
ncbi:hypothetical protein [Azospirillum sp.]|uniref:hypothetical protein n=1 Tax=Azospirillum sp. TaxID=34012 RepID=UPI003D745842